jgi:hypothetical protein
LIPGAALHRDKMAMKSVKLQWHQLWHNLQHFNEYYEIKGLIPVTVSHAEKMAEDKYSSRCSIVGTALE